MSITAQSKPDVGHVIASDLKAGKYAEAKELLGRALRESPNDARLWTLNGLALVRLGNRSEALTSYKRALQLSPDYLPAMQSAAHLEYEEGDPEAVPLLRKILKARPNDETSHAMLAAIAFKNGDCETAQSEVAKSGHVMEQTAAPLEEFGACLVKHKRAAEAISAFQRASEIQPGNLRARYNLAAVQFLAGRPRDVIVTLTLAPTLAPSGASKDPDALELLAEAYESTGDTTRALDTLSEAITQQPAAARYYVDFANICLAHALFQKGIDVLNRGLQCVPDAASLYLARGVLFCELAQYERGDADFSTAERLDPNVEFGSAVRGLAELQQNNLAEAESIIRERLRLHKADSFSYYLLAEILIRKGAAPGNPEFDEAINAASRAVELQPNSSLARDALAQLYIKQGKVDSSIEQSRLALRSNPADATATYHLILALRKAGQTDQIPALLKDLVALRQQGQKEETAERNKEAIEQSPGVQSGLPGHQ